MAYLYMQILRQVAVCFEIRIANSKFLQLAIASNYITSMCCKLSPSRHMGNVSISINASRMGCHISDVCINHVFYADDLCLIAPCAIALRDYLIFVIAIVLKLI